ncbi:MAG: hypothetical protein EOS65_09115 [Mesorhizobium sp.]|uniref:hypothetical protein n=1 Tax=Mesorhizobium sp. TaxID=1871066 RepID=UPI000FEA5570|nr:hypothetical protein [Mesorhizobium sp.]RWF42422.1 MAG: hypothetical protein EOS65_09115 [Mesorhizobium sp.]TIX10957.1 MAG: hypothetical protein E5V41_27940 [Mesorhizobium sp.]TJW08611.1 MAG: hypothetical protein E5W97_05165 [Mesorhizobium sp.]
MNYKDVVDKYNMEDVRISTRIIDADDGGSPIFLIEGTESALKMMSEIFLSAANDGQNGGFSISPKGAGRAYFSSSSTTGIYINRIES